MCEAELDSYNSCQHRTVLLIISVGFDKVVEGFENVLGFGLMHCVDVIQIFVVLSVVGSSTCWFIRPSIVLDYLWRSI